MAKKQRSSNHGQKRHLRSVARKKARQLFKRKEYPEGTPEPVFTTLEDSLSWNTAYLSPSFFTTHVGKKSAPKTVKRAALVAVASRQQRARAFLALLDNMFFEDLAKDFKVELEEYNEVIDPEDENWTFINVDDTTLVPRSRLLAFDDEEKAVALLKFFDTEFADKTSQYIFNKMPSEYTEEDVPEAQA